jgi:hypothetical protein
MFSGYFLFLFGFIHFWTWVERRLQYFVMWFFCVSVANVKIKIQYSFLEFQVDWVWSSWETIIFLIKIPIHQGWQIRCSSLVIKYQNKLTIPFFLCLKYRKCLILRIWLCLNFLVHRVGSWELVHFSFHIFSWFLFYICQLFFVIF